MYKRRIWIGLAIIYLFLAVMFSSKMILSLFDRNILLMIPENANILADNYIKIFIGSGYTWNDYLSQPSWGLDFVSYRSFLWIISILFNMSNFQVIVLERIMLSFIAFFGAFFLSQDYISRIILKNRNYDYILMASFLSSLLYGLNPSFMIGDAFWIGIQFSFVSFPWIIWIFNKAILDNKLRYAIICAFVLALNIDEHFLWAGFPIFLGSYASFIFVLKLLREKSIDFSPLIIYTTTILIFIGMIAYRLIINIFTISSYQLSLTKAGVDIPWMYGSFYNMSRAMSHMSLPDIYVTNIPLTLLIPVFAYISLYKRNWITIFYGTMTSLSILLFASDSPLKPIHYWIFFNTPFGAAFRTWRIPDAFISLSMTIMLAFSLYYIFQMLQNKKYLSIFVSISMIYLLLIYSWPLFTGDVGGTLKPTKIPDEFLNANSFLYNQTNDDRSIYLPEFTYSGQYSKLKPFWSSEIGAIQEFLTYSSPKDTFWPNGVWGHFYDFSISPFYYSLLRKGDIEDLSYFLKFLDIRYMVIHDDVPSLSKNIKNQIGFLNNSNNFKLVFNDGFVYIFENKINEEKINGYYKAILIDGGFRVMKEYFNQYGESNNGFIFIDQKLSTIILDTYDTIITDKPNDQLIKDIIFSKYVDQNKEYTVYPYNYINEHDPKNRWSRASYLDPHQQVWHPYINWKDYAWDFDYMKGITFTIDSKDNMKIPMPIKNSGDYIMLLRYFANDKGGKISIDINNKIFFRLKTINDYNGFLLADKSINLNEGENYLDIRNIEGFNAISSIVLIPKDTYQINIEDVENYISNRDIINVNNQSSSQYHDVKFVQSIPKYKDIKSMYIPHIITNYTKINSVTYKIRSNTTKPFMLSFTESYDPFWTAKIDRINNKPITSEKIPSIPLNSLINGFWINQTGDLDITIEYGMQKWFYIGIIISIITFISCLYILIRNKRG